jgi:hypothetical protein
MQAEQHLIFKLEAYNLHPSQMKPILFFFAAMLLLTSCKSNKKQPAQDSAVLAKPADSTILLLSKFSLAINGIWVKTDYINDIVKTRSPYASREKLGGIASLYIGIGSSSKDSSMVGASLNNHEGYSFPLYFKAGKKNNSLKTGLPDFNDRSNYYDLGYVIKGVDTSLFLYHYNKSGRLLRSTRYSRVFNSAPPESDMGFGIAYIINQKLITGKYLVTDTAGTVFNVEFTNEGKVSGFLNFENYMLNADFEAGPENDLDELYFDVYKKNKKDYLVKLNADTLSLFDVAASPDSIHLQWGKLRYRMIKQK